LHHNRATSGADQLQVIDEGVIVLLELILVLSLHLGGEASGLDRVDLASLVQIELLQRLVESGGELEHVIVHVRQLLGDDAGLGEHGVNLAAQEGESLKIEIQQIRSCPTDIKTIIKRDEYIQIRAQSVGILDGTRVRLRGRVVNVHHAQHALSLGALKDYFNQIAWLN
jgi:hypothetical protein